MKKMWRRCQKSLTWRPLKFVPVTSHGFEGLASIGQDVALMIMAVSEEKLEKGQKL